MRKDKRFMERLKTHVELFDPNHDLYYEGVYVYVPKGKPLSYLDAFISKELERLNETYARFDGFRLIKVLKFKPPNAHPRSKATSAVIVFDVPRIIYELMNGKE